MAIFKRFLLISLLLLVCFIGKAQTLTITDIESANDKMYKQATEGALGKNMVLTVYDNTIKLKLPGAKPVFLKRVKDGEYSGTMEETATEIWQGYLKVNSIIGFTTSATLDLSTNSKTSKYPWATEIHCVFKAKRF